MRFSAKNRPAALLLFGVAVAGLVGGMLLHPVAADPDAVLGTCSVIGAFLLFLSWSANTVAWGVVFTKLLRLEDLGWAMPLVLGPVGAALSIFAIALLGGVGAGSIPVLLLLLFLGHALNFKVDGREPPLPHLRRPRFTDLPLLLLIGACLTALLSNCDLVDAGDALRYHLVAPRMWSEAGRMYFAPRFPYGAQCAYWESLTLWGNALLIGPDGGGLIESQLFAGWTHSLFGFCASAVLLSTLLAAFSKNKLWITLATLAAVCVPPLSIVARFAKNDYGAAAWVLGGALLLLGGHCKRRRHFAAAGLLLGCALGAKISMAPIVLSVLVAWFISKKNRKLLKHVGLIAAALVAGFAPVAVRNFVWTGNPFFPAMNQLFQSHWLSPTLAELIGFAEARGLDFTHLRVKFTFLFLSCPSAVLVFLFPLVRFKRWRGLKRFWPLVFCSVLSFALLCLKLKAGGVPLFDVRYYGPGLLLMTATGTLLLGELIASAPELARTAAMVAVAAATLWMSNLEWRAWTSLPAPSDWPLTIRNHVLAGNAQAWLRMNARPGELIVSSGFDEIYYISHLPFTIIGTQPELDQLTLGIHSPAAMVTALRRYDAKYLLDAQNWFRRYWTVTVARLGRAIEEHPESVVFQGPDSMVVDLVRLEQELSGACLARRSGAIEPF